MAVDSGVLANSSPLSEKGSQDFPNSGQHASAAYQSSHQPRISKQPSTYEYASVYEDDEDGAAVI